MPPPTPALLDDSVNATDHFFQGSDGLRLYCAVYDAREPDGLPVLCLPGLTRNHRDFADLAQHLSARHEVLAPDLRGRGRSSWDPDPSHYELLTYVRDAWSLLESVGVSRACIIGTSLGALMAMVMAAEHPDRVAGIVLNDAGPELDPRGLRRIASYAGKLPAVANWTEAAAQTRSVYGDALPGFTDAQWLEFAHRGYRENAAGVPVADIDPRISEAFRTVPKVPPDMWPLYARLSQVQILVIRGALSDLLSAATVARMVREKPDLQHISVANRGHTPLLDEPECLMAIDAFLAGKR
jgi:pimeloyl-ACP methyl ester carboxylesterase